jgi:hypothetical protein
LCTLIEIGLAPPLEVLSGEPWVMGDAFFFSVFLFSELLDTQQERCSSFFFFRSNNDAA